MTESTVVAESRAWPAARACILDTDELTLRHMCDAARIPAPSGSEGERGRWFADRLHELGLAPVTDSAGNVHAVTPAADTHAKRLVIAAHLDTVFDAGTPLDVRRDGGRLTGPGISDNARGLAGLLALARGLHSAGWPTERPLALVATVGEEGAGDLRGVKHYISHHARSTAAFIALDGAGAARIITAGVGSRRLRVTFRGPGGHSWSDWGVPNAIHAAGRAIAALTSLRLPSAPRTTLSVGRIGGGTSINAVPGEAWFEVDLRSESLAPLQDLEAEVRDQIERTRRAEARTREMQVDVSVFGDRPAGRTSEADPLVQAAVAATRDINQVPQLASSSTDANVPMAEGIPAIAIGAGGDAGGSHTLREWYDNRGGPAGLERALRIILETAGLVD
ncbi:MAG TPA: M20/M25/M40 family metallo-hydrolase [Longimicrobiales bacterium]|nr:M20/M25/M40 family metallo-hydrolase [Longimicrobiales bacterium]